MSAHHIAAEAGRTYLMQSGVPLRVETTKAAWVAYSRPGESYLHTVARSTFERAIESVLE